MHRSNAASWPARGIVAGVVGAAAVALLFLVVDVAEGQALRTPGALGSALFLGEPLPPGADPAPAIVVGYTVLHGVLFVSLGLIASYLLVGRRRGLAPSSGIAGVVMLFAGLEVLFLAFAGLFSPGLLAELGTGAIATANLVAAVAMSGALLHGFAAPPPRH